MNWITNNPNVKRTFSFIAAQAFVTNVWFNQTFSAYVFFKWHHSTLLLGFLSALRGCLMALLAPIAGYTADKKGRAGVLKVAGYVGFAAAFVTSIGLFTPGLVMLCIGVGLWGIYSGLFMGPLEAIFADSVPTGHRSIVYTHKFIVRSLASTAGPLTALLLYALLGNEWELGTLRVVMLLGLGISLAPSFMLLHFKDNESLSDLSESLSKVDHDPLRVHGGSYEPDDVEEWERDDLGVGKGGASNKGEGTETGIDGYDDPVYDEDSEDGEDDDDLDPSEETSLDDDILLAGGKDSKSQRKWLCLSANSVPYLITGSDMIIAWGAGMTIQFVPLYFVEDYGASPILIAFIFATTPVLIAITSLLARRACPRWGRVRVAIGLNIVGTACLYGLSIKLPLYVVIPLFLVRTAFMNASNPIQRALMMDWVPKESRGRWNSAESLTQFTWTGSAAIGGWLVSTHSYRFTFLVTAFMYTIGTLPLFLLFPIVGTNDVGSGGKSRRKRKGAFRSLELAEVTRAKDELTRAKAESSEDLLVEIVDDLP